MQIQTGRKSFSERLRERMGDQAPLDPLGTPLELETGRKPFSERLREQLASEPLTFGDAWDETFKEGGWKKNLPFFGAGFEVDEMHDLWTASDRLEQGTATKEDQELVMAFAAASQREQGVGYMAGSILAALPGFMVEFMMTGGIANMVKAGGTKALGKGLREAIEVAAEKRTKVKIAEMSVREMAVAAPGAVARGATQAALQTIAGTAIGEAVGGSRIQAGAWRRALPDMHLSEDEAGRMNLVFTSTVGDFADELLAATGDEFIEMFSEGAGGALSGVASKATGMIPGSAKVAAMQAQVAEWWLKKHPGQTRELLKTVANQAGWHGPVSEFLEERFGGALRGATGVEEGGILANTFPSLDQMAAEMIAFSVPGAIGVGAEAVTSRPESTPHEDVGFEVEAPEGEPVSEEEITAAVAGVSERTKTPLVRVEAPDKESRDAEAFAAARGANVAFVESEGGEPLPFNGATIREGLVLIDAQAKESPSGILVEELFHDLERKDKKLHDSIGDVARAIDPDGYDTFLEDYKGRFKEAWGYELPFSKEDPEGLGNYAQAHAGLVYMATTKPGRDALSSLAQNNRNLIEKLRDWMADALGTFGVSMRKTQERRLAALDAYLGTETPTTAQSLTVATALGEALEAMLGLKAPTERAIPTTRRLDPGKREDPAPSSPAEAPPEPVRKPVTAPKKERVGVTEEPEAVAAEGGLNLHTVRERLLGGEDLSKHRLQTREEQEDAEMGVVLASRMIVEEGESEDEIFEDLVDLYERQPRPGVRDTDTVLKQQYSTPAPLAYVASVLADAETGRNIYEPTAGHGLLLVGVKDLGTVVANELDTDRANRMEQHLEMKVSRRDAASWTPGGTVDTIIANPPFGTVRDDEGEPVKFAYQFGDKVFHTGMVDHGIIAKSLETLDDDGRAVFIIGSQKSLAKGAEARAKGRKALYNKGQKRIFFRELYKNWNVTHHVTIDGALYKGQGASWPVDVIVIEGRGTSTLKAPADEVPRILETWNEVQDLLESARPAPRTGGRDGDEGRGDDRGALPVAPDVEGDDAGLQPGEQEGDGAPGRGAGAGGAPGGVRAGGSVAVRDRDADGGPVRGAATGVGADVASEGEAGLPSPEDDIQAVAPSADTPADIASIFKDAVDQAYAKPAKKKATRKKAAKKAKPKDGPPRSKALDDIADLFSLPKFDEGTYAKVRPAFEERLAEAGVSESDTKGIVDAIVGYFKNVAKFTKERLLNLQQYVVRFITDLQGGEPVGSKVPGPRVKSSAVPTDSQVPYDQESKTDSLGTLIPSNMQTAMKAALRLITKETGLTIDQYVQQQMGWEFEEMAGYLGGEQVDAVALGIYAMQRGRAFILGDQTGVGKGRVVAALLQWSKLQGRTPVFFTKAPGLFADIFRDLNDIGVTDFRPMVTHRSFVGGPIELPDGSLLRPLSQGKTGKYAQAMNAGEVPEGYNAVFTTYKQFTPNHRAGDGKYPRHGFMEAISANSNWILDESHEAAGTDVETTGSGNKPASVWMREVLREVAGASFSSATFSKNPQSMTLYERTDLGLLFPGKDGGSVLVDTIATGGVPMQQVVSTMLTQAGQMVRRERSFEGVEFTENDVTVDTKEADTLADTLRTMFNLDIRYAQVARAEFVETILPSMDREAFHDAGVGDVALEAAQDAGFGSKLANVVSQAMLSLKAPAIADQAIEEWKAGRKPVITFNYTLGAALKRYQEKHGLSIGDEVPDASFRSILMDAVQRMRRITLKDPDDAQAKAARHIFITDEHFQRMGMGSVLTKIQETEELIDSLDFTRMSLSPVDVMTSRMRKAGMNVEELTGRSTIVDFTGAKPVLASRPNGTSANQGRITGFNDGTVDALVFNTVASTGYSMHAKASFKDQRRRVMLIAEFNPNIFTFKQTLGRIHRTGQVTEPTGEATRFEREEYGLPQFRVMFSNVPIEQRNKATLRQRMGELNANTTATVASGDTLQSTPAFLNKYGDQVALDVIQEMDAADVSVMNLSSYQSVDDRPDSDNAERIAGLARKLTGKLALLPVSTQAATLDTLIASYVEMIRHLDAIGENDLEAKLEELDARRVRVSEAEPADGPSPFQAPVYEERLDVLRLYPPIAFEEMQAEVEQMDPAEMLAGIKAELPARIAVLDETEAELKPRVDELDKLAVTASVALETAKDAEPGPEAGKQRKDSAALSEAKAANARARKNAKDAQDRLDTVQLEKRRLNKRASELEAVIGKSRPGNTVLVESDRAAAANESGTEKDVTFGVVTHFERRGKTKSALSASDYVLTIRTASTTNPIKIPLSRVVSGKVRLNTVDAKHVREKVELARQSGREEVSVLTGNIPRAWARFGRNYGRIGLYRDSDGEVRSGVILREGASVKQILLEKPLEVNVEQMRQLLAKGGVWTVRGAKGHVELRLVQGNATVTVGSGRGSVLIVDDFDKAGVKLRRLSGAKRWAPVERLGTERSLELAQRAAGLMGGPFVVVDRDKDAARAALGINPTDLKDVEFSLPRRGRKVIPFTFDGGNEGVVDHARRLVQDKDLRIKRIEEAMRRAGGRVTDDNSVYAAIEAYPGKVLAQAAKWEREFLNPILKLVGDNDISLNDVDLFLYARHAEERNNYLAGKHEREWIKQEITRIRNQAKSEAVEAQAARDTLAPQVKVMEGEERKEGLLELRRLQKSMVSALRRARDPMAYVGEPPADLEFQDPEEAPGSGMSTKTADKYLAEFQEGEKGEAFKRIGSLVDLLNANTREDQTRHSLISSETAEKWAARYKHYVPLRTAVEPGRESMGERFDTRASITREAWGRRSYAHSPFTYSVLQARRAIVFGNKNQIGLSLLRLIANNKKMLQEQFEARQIEHGEADDGEMIPTKTVPSESEFGLKRNGADVYVRVADRLVLRALKGLGDKHPGPVVKVFASVNRFLSTMSTSLDPGFMFGNFTRDLQAAGINLAGEQSNRLAMRVIGATLSGVAVKAAWRGITGKGGGSEWDQAFADLEAAGGLTGWFYVQDFENEMKSLARDMADFNPSNTRKVGLFLRGVGQKIEDANRAVENGVRLAAFKLAREEGMTTARAASLAKNLTVNFNRRGEWGQVMNALYMFYNASVQGSIRMFQALRHKNVRKIAGGIVLASALLDAMNRALGDDDEDGVAFYDKIPEWVKSRNLIVMIPGSGGDYFKLPLPYGYSAFHAIGQQASSVIVGEKSKGDALAGIVSVAWESFYPLGGESSLAQSVLPTLADPLVQLASNQTFYGSPIRPTPFGSPAPPRSQLYWSSVNPNLRDFAAWVNKVTGGDRIESGAVDMSPEDLEHILGFALGGVGRQGKRAWDFAARLSSGQDSPIRDVPIVRRFYGEADERFNRERYTTQRSAVKRAKDQIKEYADEPLYLSKVRREKAHLLRLVPAMNATEKALRGLRKHERAAKDRGQDARVLMIQKRMAEVRAKFSALFGEASK